MKIHKIYVVGPYRSKDKIQKKINISLAGKATMDLCEKGWFVFCPHLNTGWLDEALPNIPQEFWISLGSAFQPDCEAIYLLKGWQQSQGSLMEFRNAQAWGQQIFEQGRSEPPDLNKVMV